jgi:hypothetical protein
MIYRVSFQGHWIDDLLLVLVEVAFVDLDPGTGSSNRRTPQGGSEEQNVVIHKGQKDSCMKSGLESWIGNRLICPEDVRHTRAHVAPLQTSRFPGHDTNLLTFGDG